MAFQGTNFKPPKGTGKLQRHARRVENDQKLADAYAVVDGRDASICWVTGVYLVPGAVMPANRREHHHLKGRRVRPDWIYKPERIITVSALAHELIEGGFIDVEGHDARRPIFFHWNEEQLRLYKMKKPFRLVSRRTVAA